MARKKKLTQPLLAGEVGAQAAYNDFDSAARAEEERRRRGRPAGAKNREVDVADAQPPTACIRCGSTNRAPYFNRRDLPIAGRHPVTCQLYQRIVIRRTRCLDCGQHRDDRHFLG